MSLSDEIKYTDEVSPVREIQFGISSQRDTLEKSVCEVYDHITSLDKSEGTVFDRRMGTSQRNGVNALSQLSMMYDPGNFGHINLAKPVLQYQYITHIINVLNNVCHRCSAILINKSLETVRMLKSKGRKARSIAITNLRNNNKIKNCPNCGACIVKFSKDKDILGWLFTKKTIYQIPGDTSNCLDQVKSDEADDDDEADEPKKTKRQAKGKEDKKREVKHFVDPEVALNILQNISDEDVELLGYDNELCRPDWMIITVIPVPPPSMRPAVQTEAGLTSDDDLTHKLNDIVKTNNQIRNLLEENDPEKTKHINTWWQLLQYHVATYVDNDISSGPRAVNRSGRAYKTLRQRIKAKEGRIRGNLMGKRVDGSARTVISPDPNISIDELGIPMDIMTNLTYPDVVTTINIAELTQLVRNGPKWPGAKCIKYSNTSSVEQKLGRCPPTARNRCVLKYLDQEQRNKIVLRPGDIVFRHLLEGDIVLLNRQPSLHKMSMMAHRVRPRKARSFGVNINVTQPYGADFDGDEMNIHVPRSLQGVYELKRLALVPTQIVSPQASSPVMGLVQDSLLGVYRLTKTSRPDYKMLNLMNVMHLAGWMDTYQGILPTPSAVANNNPVWNGRSIMSAYFPKISYLRDSDDNRLLIKNGAIESGFFDKSSFGAKSGSVIHVTWNDYGPETTRHLFDNTMNTACQWLLIDGFSVGLKDVYITPKDHQEIQNKIKDKLIEAKLKIDFLHKGWYPILGDKLQEEFNQRLTLAAGHVVPMDQERFLDTGKPIAQQFEIDIYSCLDKARAIAERETNRKIQEVAERESRSNCMESMIGSGSKGNKTNLVQIVSLLGQQAIEGGRVPEDLNRRTLPHFYKDNLTPEARGFISSSYQKGLTPTEYFFHTMAGRIGVISTSIKTAKTGYLQRRLMKIMEDAKIAYDGTVRNANDMILQYSYGRDGFDGSKIELTKFDYIDMSNSNFQATYQYMPDESVASMLTPEAYAKLMDTDNWKDVLDQEFTRINDDRNLLKYTIFENGVPEKIYSPVNFRRLIKNYQYRYGLIDQVVADISPTYIVERVEELVRELIQSYAPPELIREATQEHLPPPFGTEADFTILAAMIRSHLASKKIIREHYNRAAFDFLLEEIRRQFYQALVAPGEMVGAIAAQSIGEPSTQMTLDTFHSTGIGSGANVSRGVPRLEEILRVAQTLQTPALEVYLDSQYLRQGKEPNEVNSPEEKQRAYHLAEEIAANLEYTTLRDIVNSVQIVFDESDCSTLIAEDQAFLDSYYEFMSEDCRPKEASAPWLLRIQFREDELYKRGITLLDVQTAIADKSKSLKSLLASIDCIFSDDNAEQLIARVRVAEGVLNNDNPVNIMRLLERLLLSIKIKGVDNITTARVRLLEPVDFYRSDGTIGKTYSYMIDTAGVNLIEVFNVPYVDYRKTRSNHIYEILEVLGISAARQQIINEINAVMTYASAYVNQRHIELLADIMCREGYIISVDRHGSNKSDSGPWARASFEETTNQLFNAAANGESDPMTGVSANIMFGQPFPGGTNCFDVALDEMLLETSDIPDQSVDNTMGEPSEYAGPQDCTVAVDDFMFHLRG